ncbi:MAG: HAD family hydrolase [Cyclobacteriaceae bacterium]|jgi:2-haloacid dehalogenase
MESNSKPINTVIFDLGGVLIDWNPRYLYRTIFRTEEEVEWFLTHVCTTEWNEQQDAGRSFAAATEELVARFPGHESAIRAWYDRWQETIRGPILETVDVLETLKKKNQHRLYALTNWSAETFPWALQHFPFLHWFEGIVVSGVEKTRKPFPDIYQILFDRYQVVPAQTLFIDDNHANIQTAKSLGLHTIHFTSPEYLRQELTHRLLL